MSFNMKNITTLIISTFFIATFGVAQPSFDQHIITDTFETPLGQLVRAAEWSDIPDTSFYEDSNLYINLNDYVNDDGDPDSTLRISIEGGDQIFVNLDSLSHIVNFSSVPDSSGFTEYFIATVTDPWGAIKYSVKPLESGTLEKFTI
jgi:hypothetical protein